MDTVLSVLEYAALMVGAFGWLWAFSNLYHIMKHLMRGD